jgi:hypothetical protein
MKESGNITPNYKTIPTHCWSHYYNPHTEDQTDVGPSIYKTPEVTLLDVHRTTILYHDRTLA